MAGNKKGKSKKQQQQKREISNPHKSNSKVDVGRKMDDASSSNTTLVNPQEVLHSIEQQIEGSSSNIDDGFIYGDETDFDQIHLNPSESLPKRLDEEKSFEDWLKKSSGDQKDEMISKLENLAISLEEQINECKDRAGKKVREAIAKEKHNISRPKLGNEELKKKKKEIVNSRITKMVKKGLDKRKESSEIRADGKTKTIEAQNSEIRADDSAVKMDEEEVKRNLKLAIKEEKEEQKNIKNSEKQICKFQGQIREEKEKILKLDQNLHLVNQAQKEAKLKLKHEQQEGEKANNVLLEERRLTRIAKENANKRLASLNQELEIKQKLAMNHKWRIIEELSSLILKVPYLLANENDESCSSSSHIHILEEGESSQTNTAQEEDTIPDHRRCILCLEKDVCVLFIPCAHQVVCYDCSATVENYCPWCQVKIEKKIRVYGGNS